MIGKALRPEGRPLRTLSRQIVGHQPLKNGSLRPMWDGNWRKAFSNPRDRRLEGGHIDSYPRKKERTHGDRARLFVHLWVATGLLGRFSPSAPPPAMPGEMVGPQDMP